MFHMAPWSVHPSTNGVMIETRNRTFTKLLLLRSGIRIPCSFMSSPLPHCSASSCPGGYRDIPWIRSNAFQLLPQSKLV